MVKDRLISAYLCPMDLRVVSEHAGFHLWAERRIRQVFASDGQIVSGELLRPMRVSFD